MTKPFVYIASPYTKGDPCVNANFQARIFDQMMNDGIVIPYIPLWSHGQHTILPRPYKDWIDYDNCIMPRVDALVRLNATFTWPDGTQYICTESSGADNEVKLATSLGKPCFTTIEEVYAWAKTFGVPTSRDWRPLAGLTPPYPQA